MDDPRGDKEKNGKKITIVRTKGEYPQVLVTISDNPRFHKTGTTLDPEEAVNALGKWIRKETKQDERRRD